MEKKEYSAAAVKHATKRKLLQLPSDEVTSLEQQSCDDACGDCSTAVTQGGLKLNQKA